MAISTTRFRVRRAIRLCLVLLLQFGALTIGCSGHARTIFTPDGALLYQSTGDTFMSINEAMAKHHPGVPFRSHILFGTEFDGSVAFRLLTAEPLLVFIHGDLSTEEKRDLIPEFIDSFDYNAYLNGWELAFDLRTQGIELGLGDIYVVEALGAPDSWLDRASVTGSISIMSYRRYGLSLTFVNGRLTEVIQRR